MKTRVQVAVVTEEGESEFQAYLFASEGVGLITSRSSRSFLLLDSLDYWHDLIQARYPKRKICSCKNDYFRVLLDYSFREDDGEVRNVDVLLHCSKCSKELHSMCVEINYAPTDDLIKKPLTFIENPKAKAKQQEITGFWTERDLLRVVNYLAHELRLDAHCWRFDPQSKSRIFHPIIMEDEALSSIRRREFLSLYFSLGPIPAIKIEKDDGMGISLKDEFWRKNEVIQLRSPIHIAGTGFLYYITYATEVFENGAPVPKSKNFMDITTKLSEWLRISFLKNRGRNSFDSKDFKEEYASMNQMQQ